MVQLKYTELDGDVRFFFNYKEKIHFWSKFLEQKIKVVCLRQN